MSGALLIIACTIGLGAITVVDWWTGTELRIFPLYFVPITAVALRASRRHSVAMSVVATGCWHVANVLALETRQLATYVQVLNVLTMFVAFALVGLLVSELRARLRREEETSRTDVLTGLPNRRGFMERAHVLLAANRRSARPMALAYFDLDHFKRVNDEHGHAAGDSALVATAEVLRQRTRDGDVLARFGGDEFGALFCDADMDEVHGVLERIRASVEHTMRERSWPITSSIGAVVFTSDEIDIEEVMAAADRTMYAVKQGGKNRVQVEGVAAAGERRANAKAHGRSP